TSHVALLSREDEPKKHSVKKCSQFVPEGLTSDNEIINFLLDPLTRNGPSVAKFWGAPQDAEEESMQVTARRTPTRNSAIKPAPAEHSIAPPAQ
ncbi:MAG: hypothetical protein CBC34_016840, partial [Hyphomicrobiaceae bacterium TMED74]